jgi:ethanolamine permease
MKSSNSYYAFSKSDSVAESISITTAANIRVAEALDTTNAAHPSKYYANSYQVIAFALLGSLSNIYSLWNVVVGRGLGVEIIFSVIFGLCYLMFYFCVSELTSTFPFAGGSYALARCTLGFFPGYLVGCLEAFLYILCLGLFNAGIANDITIAFPETKSSLIIFVVLIFLIQFGLCSSKRVLWWSVTAIAACTLAINITFVFGTIRYIHFQRYAYSTEEAADDNVVYNGVDDNFSSLHTVANTGAKSLIVGSGLKIFRTIPAGVCYFAGPEFLNYACDDVRHPRTQIPMAQMVGASIMLVFNIIVPILACSMHPGTMGMAKQMNPLLPSLAQVFGLSRGHALCLELPGLFGYCLCLCYALSKLTCSLAESCLFPAYFAQRREATDVPMRAMALGQVLAFISIFFPAMVDITWLLQWPNIIAILLIVIDSTQLLGYVVLRFKLARFPRIFVSPFGVYGAIIAFCAFVLSFVASVGFQSESLTSDIVILVFLVIMTAFYFNVAKYFQEFSTIEKAVMLPVHTEILNVNGKNLLSKMYVLARIQHNYVLL